MHAYIILPAHVLLSTPFFQDVLKSTRSQLERELALEDVSSVKDLPAYNMLRRWSLILFWFFYFFSSHSCNSSYVLTICNIIEEIQSSKSSSNIFNSLIQAPYHLLFSSHLSLGFLGQCPYILTLRNVG